MTPVIFDATKIACYDGMVNRTVEPGLLRIFRYFTGVAMAYFAILVLYTAFQTHQLFSAAQGQLYLNLATNWFLFGYLSWPWLRRKLRGLHIPLALIIASVVPILSNLIFLTEPASLEGLVMGSWLLLPILLVPLVLIAWQHGFQYVLLFIIFTGGVQLALLAGVVGHMNIETLPILGAPFIQAFAFGAVGHIVSHLVLNLHAQREALIDANIKLSQHARIADQLATSRERNRLARELHDTLAHTLSAQAVNLEAIKVKMPDHDPEIFQMLQHSLDNTRQGLAETRRALKDLRAKQLEDLGLPLALRHLMDDVSLRANLDVKVQIPDSLPELSPDAEACVYRIAQEALENVIRHADAHHVSLQLLQEKNRLVMEIADDGIGFASTPGMQDRLGLKGMRERAMIAGGDLQVASQQGQGTKVQLAIEGRR